jgi:uncharacterized membrane protein YeaQ/YmgE (transglycosylase-associated protein family)
LASIVSVVAGYFYSKLEERLNIKTLLKITMLFILASVVIFLFLTKMFDSKIVFMAIMVFKDILWIFIGMIFGILTSMIFNIRQAKRLFGLLMAGEILAGIVAGLSVGFILNFMDTTTLLLISCFSLVISFLLLLNIMDKFSEKFDREVSEESSSGSIKKLFSNRYYLLFFALSTLSFFVFYFIDYIFYYSVEENFHSEKELANFFGLFFAILNVVNLFSSLFVSGVVLSRFGILFGLLAIPILASFGVISLFAFASISFLIIVVVKLLDEVLDISILTPTFKILYQPIPAKQRVHVLAFRETIVEPLAMGLAGLLLLILSTQDIDLICYAILALSAIWIVLTKFLKDDYFKALNRLLVRRETMSDELHLDSIDKRLFFNGLKSENEIEVIYCLEALERLDSVDFEEILDGLLTHKSPRVRASVLSKIEKYELFSFSDKLLKRLNEESDIDVQGKILLVYSYLNRSDSVDVVKSYLDREELKKYSLVALLKYGGIDGILVAGEILSNLFKSDKKFALSVLNSVSIASFYSDLVNCLNSSDREVKKLAIETIGNIGAVKLLPHILESLDDDRYRNGAINTLIKFEDRVFEQLKKLFNSTDSIVVKSSLIKVFVSMRDGASKELLLASLNQKLLSTTIYEELFRVDFKLKDGKKVYKLLEENIKSILFYLKVMHSFDKERYPNTYQVLKELKDKRIEVIFMILNFIYPKEIISKAIINFSSNSDEKKAVAVELIDNLVSNEFKKLVLDILDSKSIDKQIEAYDYLSVASVEEFFYTVLSSEDAEVILKTSLIYEIGKNLDTKYIEPIEALLSNSEAGIAQTAEWAYSRLKREWICC